MLNAQDVAAAAERISGYVRRTPVITVGAGELAPNLGTGPLVLKLELLQRSGSFKARGAFHFLLTVRPRRVVTASGGNHGLAVAVAAAALDIKAEVFVPTATPATKLDGLRAAGAVVREVGADYADAAGAAVRHAEDRGLPYLPAYDHPAVVAGQGSAALELLADAPDVDTVLVAVGGGGLLGGTVAALGGTVAALGGAGRAVRAVGVEPQLCPTLHAALAAGAPVDVPVGGVAVDALGARRLGMLPFELISAAGVQSVLVSDEAILEARTALWRALRLAVEPAAAAALAALRCGAYRPAPGERIGVLLCGGNASPAGLS
ncbi:MAG TPA: serine/threonine dehydratase [Pseudonocardiaceae bacterium]